jgi:hypothetical protein
MANSDKIITATNRLLHVRRASPTSKEIRTALAGTCAQNQHRILSSGRSNFNARRTQLRAAMENAKV